MEIDVSGKYQDYLPAWLLQPKYTQIMVFRQHNKIIKWRKHYSYIPVELIQLPPEIINMIGGYTPSTFAATCHQYKVEFAQRARFESARTRLESAFSAAKLKYRQKSFEIYIPLEFWFNRDPRLAIPHVYIPNIGYARNAQYIMPSPIVRLMDGMSGLRYSS